MQSDDPGFRRLIENLTTTVLLLDDQLRLDYMNPAGEMLFENSLRRCRGMPVADLIPGDADLHAGLRRSLDSGHPFTERERRLTLPVGREITVDMTVSPLIEATRQPTHLLVEMLHIDRQLRITREEQLLNQQATTRALVRGLAHEIKNPLGGLRGAAQLLEQELDDEELKDYTRVIIGEADRLRSLVDRMLGPNSLPVRRPVNLHDVLGHVFRLVRAEAPETVLIETDYDPSIPDISADRDMLIQAVLNIVRNALQALGEHGRILLKTRVLRQYTIGQVRHKLVAKIQVIDDGPGIPEEIRERIFFPMVTGREGGTGLGLPIAQSIVNQHGGLIECDSRPGDTRFTLLIPLETKDDEK
ncbi:MAG: nitrogen regulation protein NR(II) [Chromatiales bacterium]|jgi:two-component system nitrogen regulation sensor histidine kinase GlnL|nr:nitrogen regulation protein NR(II) [Chromatiales bacterium]MDX9767446.1 nitrogen regulation protein NR(II) [Ectothiorhodospiraceae bacterium]